MNPFSGGVAVITGAGAGIGAGLARHAAALGMTVVLADIDADAIAEVRDELCAAGGSAGRSRQLTELLVDLRRQRGRLNSKPDFVGLLNGQSVGPTPVRVGSYKPRLFLPNLVEARRRKLR